MTVQYLTAHEGLATSQFLVTAQAGMSLSKPHQFFVRQKPLLS